MSSYHLFLAVADRAVALTGCAARRNPRHQARLSRKLSDLIAEVAKVDMTGKTRLDLTVGCDDEEGEAVDVPVVTLEL